MEQTIFCRSGGCTAKLGPGALDRVLSALPKKQDPDLLVGFDSRDDAAVYRLNHRQAMVSTLDFFPPMVEDPYLFGAIAAANAMSDIYAMGGRVLTALNIVCFPEDQDLNLLGRILQGGNDKVLEAGGVLAGGHSIVDTDIKYGLSVTGVVDPEGICRNNGCRVGDALILTKKLGVGIILAAHRIGEASPGAVEEAVASMTTLNKGAAEVMARYPVHGCTDVTGFGFLGHLSEMLDGRVGAEIRSGAVPHFEVCREYAREFYLTAAAQRNRNHLEERVEFRGVPFAMEEILYDPQTSGGLLMSVEPSAAEALTEELRGLGLPAAVVGRVTEKHSREIIVM